MKYSLLALIVLLASSFKKPVTNGDTIIGKWMAVEDKNIIVQVFKTDEEYKAVITCFDDTDDKTRPMAIRCDTKNPDKTLRTKKIIGLEVLRGLSYNDKEDEWQDGHIYDPSSGKEYNAKAWLTDDGNLKVRGYWHFECLGKNMSFSRTR
ncbi:MAG: DUF2147 domain-containing protein [Bacteroidota bacterium]|jgi:uncharacterized protein (DUF2147 family)